MHPRQKQIDEIEDYLYANAGINRKSTLGHFGVLWGIPEKTIEKWYYKAKKQHEKCLQNEQKVKNEVLVQNAKESLKKAILSRDERLEILSKIAQGVSRKVENDIITPTDSDRTRAIAEMNKMEGDYAPEKHAQTDSKGKDITQVINVTLEL